MNLISKKIFQDEINLQYFFILIKLNKLKKTTSVSFRQSLNMVRFIDKIFAETTAETTRL